MSECSIAIVGGGITGLAAAWECARAGARFRLFEATARFGGLIRTERIGPYLVDAGPDSFLVDKPAALELCRELGIETRLVVPTARTAYVLRNGTLQPLPAGGRYGLPGGWRDLWAMRLLSLSGRLRLARDLLGWQRAPSAPEDESIADFFERRFGWEVAAYLAEPLLAGIHVGDARRLSMRALYPRLLELEPRHRSLLRGLRRTSTALTAADGAFRSFEDGMESLVDALVARLPAEALQAGTPVGAIEGGPPYRLHLADGRRVPAEAIILAVPAPVTARLLRDLDPDLAACAATIRFGSSVTVVLAYPRAAVRHPLEGVGFVVPRAERGRRVLAVTWVSSKWPGRAPAACVLLRAFFGGERDPLAIEDPDARLVAQAHEELAALLRIDTAPLLSRVYRWRQANPQLEVGHLARLAALEQHLGRWRGLFVAGAGYRGVGIPDCIADGRAAARAALHLLQGDAPRRRGAPRAR
jgi:oxygen-dependent protoporphyrinogen oxidase